MTPNFWRGVRLFNWFAGGIGFVCWWAALQPAQTTPPVPQSPLSAPADDPPAVTLAFSPDSALLLGSSVSLGETRLYVWDAHTGQSLWQTSLFGARPALTAILPDSKTLVSVIGVDADNNDVNDPTVENIPRSPALASSLLQFRDLRTGHVQRTSAVLATPQAEFQNALGIDVAPTGDAVAVTYPKRVGVWELKLKGGYKWWDPRGVESMPSEPGTIRDARFTADGKSLVVSHAQWIEEKPGSTKSVRCKNWTVVRSVRTDAVVKTIGPWYTRYAAGPSTLSPDRKYLLYREAQGDGENLTLVSVRTGRRLNAFPLDGSSDGTLTILPTQVSARNGKQRFRVGVGRCAVYDWDIDANRVRVDYRTAAAPKVPSPDGRLFAVPGTTHDWFPARLYQARTGGLLHTLDYHEGTWLEPGTLF